MRGIVWLLDLDGVLNFFGRPVWPNVRRFKAGFNGLSFRIRYSPDMIAAIHSVARECGAQVRLCSTWCEQPDEILGKLGLSIPSAFMPERGDSVSELKLRAALDVVRSGSRLIWTDDVDIPTSGAAFDELEAAGALLIAPDEMLGLTPVHISQIREWTA